MNINKAYLSVAVTLLLAQVANVIVLYSGVIQQTDYDPQKVGKGAMSYSSTEQSVQLAYLQIKMSMA